MSNAQALTYACDRSAISDSRPVGRHRQLAAPVVMGAFFLWPSMRKEGIALAVLLYIGILRGNFKGRAIARVLATFGVLALLVLAYFITRQSHPPWGSSTQYLGWGIQTALFIVAVAGFVCVYFDEQELLKAFWNFARLGLTISLLCYVISVTSGHKLLVNAGSAGIRLEGLLSEPSAWAGAISALFIVSLARKSYTWAGLAILGGLLAKSPMVMLVAGISLPGYYLIRSNDQSKRKIVLVVAASIVVPLLVYRIQLIDPVPYLQSSAGYKVAVGRFISGITNVKTGGTEGKNIRYSGAQRTVQEVRDNGWTYTGFGLGSAPVYLSNKFGDTQAWSMFYSILFDFGYIGVAAFVLLIAISFRRMRASPAMAILLPFSVAALFNSAQGWVLYQFAVIAIMVFAFGWAPYTRPREKLPPPVVPLH